MTSATTFISAALPCLTTTLSMPPSAVTDLIINVGHDVVEKPPFFMKPDGFKVIHINYTNASVDPVYFPQAEVTGDIANAVYQIKEKIERQIHWDFQHFFEEKILIDANPA